MLLYIQTTRGVVQADPQNERNTAEEARPAVPDGQVVSLCGSHPH